MKKIGYYIGKLKRTLVTNFSRKRIKRFGIKIAVLDLISFLCHRSSSNFQLAVVRAKDRSVQKYIYRNYGNILKKYREESL